jgi:hypothetical protein
MWHDLSTGYGIAFTVLYMEGDEFRREKAEGKVLSLGKSEIEISTRFFLKPKQMLYWVDRHKKDNIHFAAVKWCKKSDDDYRVGLSIINNPIYSLK